MTTTTAQQLTDDATALLKRLIAIPSFSKEEHGTADAISGFLVRRQVEAQRLGNNVWARNKCFDGKKPTILLNSHHDTVKPNAGYTNDPFRALEQDGKLYGLGSNDAGGCLVALLATFLHYYDRQDLRYNLIFAATAEEEISGEHGISALLPYLGDIDCAIVGEPTQMQMAVAEKGLMVLDCTVHGTAAHAANSNGDNAIYKAMKDIGWFRDFHFPIVSPLLGPVKMTVTIINAGTQHNVVPGKCVFTVDCRINECYSHEQVLDEVRKNVTCDVNPRSMRMRATAIDAEHPLVRSGSRLGRSLYGSPTLSDKALMPFPALKMGPGDSARSHSADEFIYLSEIEEGIDMYIQMLSQLL